MNEARKNVWIFGGTGFVGKTLVNYLSNDLRYHLNLLIHKNVPYKSLEAFNTFTGTLNGFDLNWLEKYPPDIIFHLARLGGRNKLLRHFASYKGAKANNRLINFLIQKEISPVIIYVSSLLMYGNQVQGAFASESSVLHPLSYAQQQILAEQPWLDVQLTEKLDVRFARPGWIIGPDSWFKNFYWNYFRETGKVPMYGNGEQLMSLVYVDDLAGQLVNLAENGGKNKTLNIYTSETLSQQSFAELLAKELNTGVEPVTWKALKSKFGKAVSEPIISSIPLKTNYKTLQNLYKPQYSTVESMLKKTISMLKNE